MTADELARVDVELPGPGSLHWRWAGEVRGYLLLVKAGLLQLMHPGLGAGVEQHSDFFAEPWERVLRSVPEIQGVTFDWPDGAATARRIREYHNQIKGVDGRGHRYHALDPEVFFWAHATIFDALFQTVDLFDHRMSDAEREQLYAESRRVFRAYGVSDRIVPPDWASFRAYFDRMCREELVITPAARGLIEFAKEPPATFPLVPAPLYRALRKPSAKPLWWIAVGTLPDPVRRQIGERWTDRDERRHQRFRRAVSASWRLVPHRLRYTERARQGYRRAGVGPSGR
ncbi:MAG TPA: oxygenase MpaB family protein [Actinophytocola sp.]|nr:oxygenase MpaB family protein [Actinophytocola sp.]